MINDAKVQGELSEINARFERHGRMTRWVLAGIIILVVLALVVLTHPILRAQGAL